jgi:hypothetical protein
MDRSGGNESALDRGIDLTSTLRAVLAPYEWVSICRDGDSRRSLTGVALRNTMATTEMTGAIKVSKLPKANRKGE